MSWSVDGKTVLITGGNSGIGKAAATELARRGATVVITARDARKGSRAVDEIRSASGREAVEVMSLDLARLSSVRALAADFLDRHERLDVLVNNAGLTLSRREQTEDGYEMTFQVNHLGPFLLTSLLLERLRASAPARIVNVASGAHKSARRGLDFDDLQFEERRYRGMKAYNASKLCNVSFTRELARRLEGTDVTVNAMHPGFVFTNWGAEGDTHLLALGIRLGRLFARSAEKGADTVVWLASSPAVEGVSGGYFFDRKLAKVSKAARDDDAARRLWEVSERLVEEAASP